MDYRGDGKVQKPVPPYENFLPGPVSAGAVPRGTCDLLGCIGHPHRRSVLTVKKILLERALQSHLPFRYKLALHITCLPCHGPPVLPPRTRLGYSNEGPPSCPPLRWATAHQVGQTKTEFFITHSPPQWRLRDPTRIHHCWPAAIPMDTSALDREIARLHAPKGGAYLLIPSRGDKGLRCPRVRKSSCGRVGQRISTMVALAL